MWLLFCVDCPAGDAELVQFEVVQAQLLKLVAAPSFAAILQQLRSSQGPCMYAQQ
jgi:hypothetical protein